MKYQNKATIVVSCFERTHQEEGPAESDNLQTHSPAMVSAEKCLQLEVREAGQRKEAGPVDFLSGASQSDMLEYWLYKSPFLEDVAIHQTLHFPTDTGCLSRAPRGYMWALGARDPKQ